VVLTKNEEAHIADCLASLAWCDHIIVLDSLSTDQTTTIARQLGAQVILRPFLNFADQRNAALDLVTSEWVFFVDADERVSAELAGEVQAAILNGEMDGWWVPEKNYYFGRLLNYGGFYPDYHLRLARVGKLKYDPLQKVHEHPSFSGKAGYLKHPLVHLCYRNLAEMKSAKDQYSALLAEAHFEKGLKPTYHLLAAPVLTFYQQLISLQGYKDGWPGFFIALVWAYYAFDEYRRARLLWNTAARSTDGDARLG
jgi:hypothetical protein